MTPIIPKEDIYAVERWQATAFDAPAVAPAAPAVENEAAGELVPEFKFPTAEDIERIHQEAHQEGYSIGLEAGRQEGLESGKQEAQRHVEHLQALAENFQRALESLDQEVADSILELALEVARQIVRVDLRCQPTAILAVIREAVATLPLHHSGVTLVVNPADAAIVREQLPSPAAHQPAWHVVEDPAIEAGGCLVRAGHSEVDATLATRWRHVVEAIGVEEKAAP